MASFRIETLTITRAVLRPCVAFRELGISSGSMRIVFVHVFVPWVPAVFYVASRFVQHTSGAVTLLALLGVPNYPGRCLPGIACSAISGRQHYYDMEAARRWLFSGPAPGYRFWRRSRQFQTNRRSTAVLFHEQVTSSEQTVGCWGRDFMAGP
jgi:hypothetical protein